LFFSPINRNQLSPPFANDFHPKTKVILNKDAFIFALACSPHLSSGGLSSMVYELLQYYFVPNDLMNGLGEFIF